MISLYLQVAAALVYKSLDCMAITESFNYFVLECGFLCLFIPHLSGCPVSQIYDTITTYRHNY